MAICQRLGESDQTKDIGVIVIGGGSSSKARKDFLAAGGIAWLTKPVDIDELLGLLRG